MVSHFGSRISVWPCPPRRLAVAAHAPTRRPLHAVAVAVAVQDWPHYQHHLERGEPVAFGASPWVSSPTTSGVPGVVATQGLRVRCLAARLYGCQVRSRPRAANAGSTARDTAHSVSANCPPGWIVVASCRLFAYYRFSAVGRLISTIISTGIRKASRGYLEEGVWDFFLFYSDSNYDYETPSIQIGHSGRLQRPASVPFRLESYAVLDIIKPDGAAFETFTFYWWCIDASIIIVHNAAFYCYWFFSARLCADACTLSKTRLPLERLQFSWN